jgi:hypothetical protein
MQKIRKWWQRRGESERRLDQLAKLEADLVGQREKLRPRIASLNADIARKQAEIRREASPDSRRILEDELRETLDELDGIHPIADRIREALGPIKLMRQRLAEIEAVGPARLSAEAIDAVTLDYEATLELARDVEAAAAGLRGAAPPVAIPRALPPSPEAAPRGKLDEEASAALRQRLRARGLLAEDE